jgi:hypothetical protein
MRAAIIRGARAAARRSRPPCCSRRPPTVDRAGRAPAQGAAAAQAQADATDRGGLRVDGRRIGYVGLAQSAATSSAGSSSSSAASSPGRSTTRSRAMDRGPGRAGELVMRGRSCPPLRRRTTGCWRRRAPGQAQALLANDPQVEMGRVPAVGYGSRARTTLARVPSAGPRPPDPHKPAPAQDRPRDASASAVSGAFERSDADHEDGGERAEVRVLGQDRGSVTQRRRRDPGVVAPRLAPRAQLLIGEPREA